MCNLMDNMDEKFAEATLQGQFVISHDKETLQLISIPSRKVSNLIT